MYPGEFVSDLNWRLGLIKARLLLSRSITSRLLALACQLVAVPREFFFYFQQFEPRFQPLFVCSGLCVVIVLSPLVAFTLCLAFGCHALYLARGIEGVGVTSVTGFRWTL
jgi:hypothetical protein